MATRQAGGRNFPRGPWPRGRGRFPQGWKYGFLTPIRTLASAAWLPGGPERRALGEYNRLPFWHVINYAPAGLTALDDQILPKANFVALAFIGNATQGPGSYQTHFFQMANTEGTGFRLSRIAVIEGNAVGTGALPFILRRPYPMPNLLSLMNRITNRATVANTIQICVYGVQEYET